jgi:hypothetical protein
MVEGMAWLVHDALPQAELERTAAAAAAYLDSGISPPDVPDALCSTHWMPLDGRPARHSLEAAVLAVGRVALAAELPPLRARAVSGLEWWLQEQWPDDSPKEMHTDVSVGLAPSGDAVSAHPLASSVTYLTGTGGPTAVFDQCPTEDGTENWALPSGSALQPATPARVALGLPSRGAMLLFVGNLFHGVLHTPPLPLAAAPTEVVPRRTLLVNFWGDHPPGAVDAPLPQLEASHVRTLPTAEVEAAQQMAPQLPLRFPSTAFAGHSEHWRQQVLPPEICLQLETRVPHRDEEGNGDPRPLVVVRYVDES